jgi:hypothetical protein
VRKHEARDLKNRIDIARKLRGEVYDREHERAMDLYRGDHWSDKKLTRDRDWITVNYLYPIVETKVAAIAFRYPDFTFRSLTKDAKENEDTSRSLLAYTFRRGKFLDEAKRVFRDFQIGGVGVGMTGWLTEAGERGQMKTESTSGSRVPVEGEEPDPTAPADTSGYGGSGEPLPRPIRRPIREDRPFLKRISPTDLFVSPECGACLDEALYCGYTERLPLATVRRHPKWKNLSKLRGTSENLRDLFDAELKTYEEDDLPADLKRVTIHHYYDRPSLKYCVFSDECDEPLYESAWPFPFLRYPFRVMRAADDENRFWPKATLLRYEHPQREINQARSLLARHQRQVAGRKYQTSARLSPNALRAWQSDDVAALVQLDGPEKIGEIPHAHVGPEVFASWQGAREDLQLLAAMNAYEAFAEPSKRLTGSEVAAIQGAGGARAKAEQEEFEAFISGVGQDALNFLQEYSVAAGQMPVFTEEKVTGWRDFTPEEIQGDYWVEVFVGSTAVPNRRMLAEQIGLLMQSAPNFVQAVMQGDQAGINFRVLLRRILEGLPEIRDVDEIVPEKPEGQPGMGMDPAAMLGQLPPELMQQLSGQMGGGPQAAGPMPQMRPDGSMDVAALDGWLRSLPDEDLAGYTNGA